jgi:catechol 2,3-dioxygenase-like lactoylglutathione lyase family enzyme
MGVRRIVPNLPARDPRAASAFYRDVLGLEVAMDLGWIVTLCAPDEARRQVSLARRDASASVDAPISVEVDDVDAAYAVAQRLGYEIVHPLTDEPWGVRRFFARDLDGNVVNVLSHA